MSKGKPVSAASPCPCGAGNSYAQCCQPFHLGGIADSAEQLMRSRYSAYVLGLDTYLLATWAEQTRPAAIDLAGDKPKWLGLDIKRTHQTDDSEAHVEFVARFKINGKAERLHENSRFLRLAGSWYYVDGVFPA